MSKKAAKKPGGRPTKRTKKIEDLICKALGVGCSFDNAAWFAEIDPETLRRWRRDDARFAGICEKARSTATFRVASGLYDRATKSDDNTASIFFLKTRAPEFRENKGPESDESVASDVDIWLDMVSAIPGRQMPDTGDAC